jgi:hypothetical protein
LTPGIFVSSSDRRRDHFADSGVDESMRKSCHGWLSSTCLDAASLLAAWAQAPSVRFLTARLQHVLIRYSASGGAHYLGGIEQETRLKTVGMNRFRRASNMTQPVKETDMKKLSIVLLAGIATLVTVIEPSFAAQRQYRGVDAYASGAATDRSGAYNFGPHNTRGYGAYASGAATDRSAAYGFSPAPVRDEALTPAQHTYDRNNGPNLPYPDRPYGAPNSW